MQNLGKPLLQPSEHSAHRHVGASLLQVVFNVMNTTFGSGFFLYPRQFATNGIITSLLLMAALLVAVVFSLHSLADAVARSPAHLTAYPETNGFLTRPCCSRLVSATINLYLVMAASAYIGLVADQVHSLLGDAAPARWIVLLGPLAFAAPFSLLRRFSSFAITSAFGIFVNSFVVVVLCSEAASILMRRGVAESMGGAQQDGPPSYADDSQSTAATSFFNLATLSTTVVFSFQCHSDAFIPADGWLTHASRPPSSTARLPSARCSTWHLACSVRSPGAATPGPTRSATTCPTVASRRHAGYASSSRSSYPSRSTLSHLRNILRRRTHGASAGGRLIVSRLIVSSAEQNIGCTAYVVCAKVGYGFIDITTLVPRPAKAVCSSPWQAPALVPS